MTVEHPTAFDWSVHSWDVHPEWVESKWTTCEQHAWCSSVRFIMSVVIITEKSRHVSNQSKCAILPEIICDIYIYIYIISLFKVCYVWYLCIALVTFTFAYFKQAKCNSFSIVDKLSCIIKPRRIWEDHEHACILLTFLCSLVIYIRKSKQIVVLQDNKWDG